MPTTRRIPKYRLKKTTGRAVVTLNGVDHWLGKRRQKYDRLVAEWLANGRETPHRQNAPDIIVIELAARSWIHCEMFYRSQDGSPTTEDCQLPPRP